MWILYLVLDVLVEASLHIRIWATVQLRRQPAARHQCVSPSDSPGAGTRLCNRATVLACLLLLIKLTFALSQTQTRLGYWLPPMLVFKRETVCN